MKKLFLLLMLALSFTVTYANPVDSETAKNIGEKFMKASTTLGLQRNSIKSDLAHTLTSDNGTSCLYVFNIEEGGFVIVSAEDRVKPILAYSTKGSFNANDAADGILYYLDSYKEEIEYVRNNNIKTTNDIKSEWELVSASGRIKESRSSRSVEPLLETTWNQGAYYNDQCPEDPEGPNGHVYSGCVASAMAQVIKYWNHPVIGTGSHSYTPGGWGYPSYPTQTANFGETYYNFELMPMYLDSLSTEEEIFYIAQLQHHCGVAVDMMYSSNGSGAYSFDVPYALEHYFEYNSGMELHYLDYFYNNEWAVMLKSEIDLGHPIYYSGADDGGQGGHAFVCDGYDEYDFFHFNWGWGGRDDAYCAIGALNTTRYAFNSQNSAIEGCYPASEDYFNRPERISNLTLTELDTHNGVTISWTNPTVDLSGNALTTLDSVFVRRNFQTIASFGTVSAGESMSYTDTVSESRVYEYSVYTKNSVGNSIPVYESILIGPKCDLVFELRDSGANGWKGGSISVIDENSNRIAVITMEDGAYESRTVELLQGELDFVWNIGWFTGMNDGQISFTVYDLNNNTIYNSQDSLVNGYLFSYNNTCDETLICERPQNFSGEYLWESGIFGANLHWTLDTDNLVHFNLYRSEDNVNYTLISVIDATESTEYEYFDEVSAGTYYYMVKAYYERGDESCESEAGLTSSGEQFVILEITSIDENKHAPIEIYPNPTFGQVTVKAKDLIQITIYDIIGQEVGSYVSTDNETVISLDNLQNGVYFFQIKTDNDVVTKKVILSR